MPRSQPERRRFPRFPSENALLLKKVGDGGPGVPARTLEISAGGCKLVHDTRISLGSEVELSISAGGRSIRAFGRVIYELPLRSARFQIGVAFLQLDAEDQEALAALLQEQAAPQLI